MRRHHLHVVRPPSHFALRWTGRCRTLLAVAMIVGAAAGTAAQGNPTGAVRGQVLDPEGLPIPGVSITAASSALQGTRSAVTSSNGDFIIPFLPPGEYTITFELQGFRTHKQTIGVAMAETLPIAVSLPLASVTEAVTVTGTVSTEITKTPTVAETYQASSLELLPVARTLTGAVLLAPGVAPNGPNSNIVISGALSYMGVSLWSQRDRIADQSRKLHASALVLDTHVDIPNLLRPDWTFTDEHREDHVDLPRLRKGGLDALFMSIYMSGTVTGPQAVNNALERIAAVHKLAEDLPAEISLCTTAEQVRRAHREGKVAVLLGMEGGHMINNSLPILRTYAKLGVRYLTLTHSVNTDWADSSGDQPKHKGLTEFGRQVVRELNWLGVMVDISHVADKTFWDALEISRAPMIASHSSSRAIARHHRNMTDEMIKALAAKGGVIQINYAVGFLDDERAQYSLRVANRQRALDEQFPGPQNAEHRRAEIVREFGPAPQVRWEKIVEHIDHVVKLVGPDHVGLGSDFDGATMPIGMEDVTQLPKITEALLRRNYSEADIRKILGGNSLRLMMDVQRVSTQLRGNP